jgi:hypothetical protein
MSDDVTVVVEDDHHLRRRAVRLSWSARDPLAVRVDVGSGAWVVLRDTLRAGLTQPTGVGQVRVGPAGSDVALTLRAPGQLLVVRLRRERLRAFLEQTEAVVPAGSEPCRESLDAALEAMLDDGA